MTKKTTRVCHYNKLSITINGNIYPCCSAPSHAKIGNIFDDDIFEKIENTQVICECKMYKSIAPTCDDIVDLKILHFETSNICQANCVCCPQNKNKLQNEDEYLLKIRQLIEHFKPKSINVIGGEVLVQQSALDMLFDLQKKYPDMEITTITNLCVNDEQIKQAERIFNRMTVSFLGFSKLIYKNEMGLDFEKTMKNFKYLYDNKKVSLLPKYLAMPTNLFDIVPFFEWALGLNVEKIYLHNIHEFAQVANLEHKYWNRTFEIVEKQIKYLLKVNKDKIISKQKHFISIHQILADKLHITPEYLQENNFDKIIFITN